VSRTAYWIDHQKRALEFEAGDFVSHLRGSDLSVGRVIEVWPAIGMVDVEWPEGSRRHPVEELQIVDKDESLALPPTTDSRPVTDIVRPGKQLVDRVATAYVKKAIYWASKDRKYRASRLEKTDGCYNCPRCKDIPLRATNYKRREGKSVPLLACPGCLFIIKTSDIFGHPDCEHEHPSHVHQECDQELEPVMLDDGGLF